MSQDVSSVPREPRLIETDAEQVMDELFSDIDRILESGSKLPTEPTQSEYVSLESVVVPPIALPTERRESEEQGRQQSEAPTENPVELLKAEGTCPRSTHRSGQNLDKIIFGVACASLVAVILWLVSQGKLNLPFVNYLGDELFARNSQLSESDAQFINYMRRSLDAIEGRGK